MTNTYKPASEWGKATYGADELELDLSASEELDHLRGGHLHMVPRKYRCLVNNFSQDGKPLEQGEEFEGSLLVDAEAALIQGGVLERVEAKPAKKTTKKAAEKPKND